MSVDSQDAVNPLSEIAAAPPGRLALDCMYFFATKHRDMYSKVRGFCTG